MTLNAKFITLSAFAALSFGMAGCSDDSAAPVHIPDTPEIPPVVECTENACLNDSVLKLCRDGKISLVDCTQNGQVCMDNACKVKTDDPIVEPKPEPECSADVCLDGTTLNKCVDGKFVAQDCTKSNKICSNDACVEDTTIPEDPKPEPECTADACANSLFLNKCNDGKIVQIDCSENNQICQNDACVDKPECEADSCINSITLSKCNDGKVEIVDCSAKDQICDNNACVPKPACTEDTCFNDLTLAKCSEGKVEMIDCSQNDQVCKAGVCVEKPQCTEDSCINSLTLAKCKDSKIEVVDCSKDGKICSSSACVKKPVDPVKCDPKAEATCDGAILVTCTPEGVEERIDCTEESKLCDAAAKECVTPAAEKCKTSQNACDGTTAVLCNESSGLLDRIDCTQENKICKSTKTGDVTTVTCDWECEVNTYETSCVNATTAKICEDHHIITKTCAQNESCKAGACVVKSPKELCLEKGMEWLEATQECVTPSVPSVVGGACKCLNNCTITISGKEIKSIINSTVQGFASDLFNQIKDTDTIVAPNYFPGKENIEGCDELAAVVPEGMTLGCFRDSKITFPKGLTDLMKNLPTTKLSILGIINIDMSEFLDAEMAAKVIGIADLLANGIEFAAPNGYCLAATIDIGGTIAASMTNLPLIGSLDILTSNPLDKTNGLVKKINTGDHATVVANAAKVDNYCPVGSTLFSYTMNFDKPISMDLKKVLGKMMRLTATIKGDIGFDMCLKSCNTDDDCRKDEGYSCVEMPDGVPAEGQTYDDMPKKKVCFDQANIDYFTKMTEDFSPET